MLIALSCDPKLSPAGQQTGKHDGLYPLLTVSLTVLSLLSTFSSATIPVALVSTPQSFSPYSDSIT